MEKLRLDLELGLGLEQLLYLKLQANTLPQSSKAMVMMKVHMRRLKLKRKLLAWRMPITAPMPCISSQPLDLAQLPMQLPITVPNPPMIQAVAPGVLAQGLRRQLPALPLLPMSWASPMNWNQWQRHLPMMPTQLRAALQRQRQRVAALVQSPKAGELLDLKPQ